MHRTAHRRLGLAAVALCLLAPLVVLAPKAGASRTAKLSTPAAYSWTVPSGKAAAQVIWENNGLWVIATTTSFNSYLLRYNSTGSVVSTTSVGRFVNGLDDLGGYLWVTSLQDETIYKVSKTDGSVVDTFSLGFVPGQSVAVVGNTLYVANEGDNAIVAIDLTTKSQTWITDGPILDGYAPRQIVADNGLLYLNMIASSGDEALVKFDPSSLTVLGSTFGGRFTISGDRIYMVDHWGYYDIINSSDLSTVTTWNANLYSQPLVANGYLINSTNSAFNLGRVDGPNGTAGDHITFSNGTYSLIGPQGPRFLTTDGTSRIFASSIDGTKIVIQPFPTLATPGAVASLQSTGSSGPGTMTASWDAPTDNGGANITSYTASISPADATQQLAGDGWTATFTGLTDCTTYTVTVTPSNFMGAGTSSTTTFTPGDPATCSGGGGGGGTPPSAVDAVNFDPQGASVVAYWNMVSDWGTAAPWGDPTGSGYKVTLSPGDVTVDLDWATSQTTFTGLTDCTTYTISVYAFSPYGNGTAATSTYTPGNPSTCNNNGGGGGGGSGGGGTGSGELPTTQVADPFSCSPYGLQFDVVNGQLATSSDLVNWNPVGLRQQAYNAMAFNPNDGYLYAVGADMAAADYHHLLRVQSDGSVIDLGKIKKVPYMTAITSGEIDPNTGIFWIAGTGRALWSVDLDTHRAYRHTSPWYQTMGADLTIIDGTMFTISKGYVLSAGLGGYRASDSWINWSDWSRLGSIGRPRVGAIWLDDQGGYPGIAFRQNGTGTVFHAEDLWNGWATTWTIGTSHQGAVADGTTCR